jgi:hypothetical protein
MKRVNILAAGLILVGQALSGGAVAASVTLYGTNVDFTFDNAMLGLFGPANVSGDTLFFTPSNFKASSLNGMGYTFNSETVNVRISAHDGQKFSSLDLTERGDYLLLGAGRTADVAGQVRVFDVAHPLTDLTASILPTSPLNLVGTPTHDWTANASLGLGRLESARAINVTLENILLSATTNPASMAFIEKKFVGLTPSLFSVTPVPEAETYAMMLAGLGLVGWMARRRAMPK